MRSTAGRTSADEPVPSDQVAHLREALRGCQELHALRAEGERIKQAEIERLHGLIHDMLEGPWAGTEQMARMLACRELDHPRIHADPERECYCRLVKP